MFCRGRQACHDTWALILRLQSPSPTQAPILSPASVSPCVTSYCLSPAQHPPNSRAGVQRHGNVFSQTPVGVSRLGPGRHLETAGEEGPRPGVNTCNRLVLQLAGARAGEELSWLEAVDPTDRQTDGRYQIGWPSFSRVVALPKKILPWGIRLGEMNAGPLEMSSRPSCPAHPYCGWDLQLLRRELSWW